MNFRRELWVALALYGPFLFVTDRGLLLVFVHMVGIAASQRVSNMPAMIALAEYSRDWRVMACALLFN